MSLDKDAEIIDLCQYRRQHETYLSTPLESICAGVIFGSITFGLTYYFYKSLPVALLGGLAGSVKGAVELEKSKRELEKNERALYNPRVLPFTTDKSS